METNLTQPIDATEPITEDEIEYPGPLDVVAAVRVYVPPEGERGSLSISGCPKYLTCAVEDLGRRASASQAKTFASLLDIGIERLWRFPGARDLQRAREAIMAYADPAAVRWIDTWDFDVPTADTGECVKKLRLSAIGILTPLGNLAKVLGVSKTAVLALAAVLLEDAAVPDRYHGALETLLRGFAAKLRERVANAEEYVAKGSNANGGSSARRSTLLDIIGARR